MQSLHRGDIDDYVETLKSDIDNPITLLRSDFGEYFPIVQADTIKPELTETAARVEFGFDRKSWCVGHGATHTADVWAAVHASAEEVCSKSKL